MESGYERRGGDKANYYLGGQLERLVPQAHGNCLDIFYSTVQLTHMYVLYITVWGAANLIRSSDHLILLDLHISYCTVQYCTVTSPEPPLHYHTLYPPQHCPNHLPAAYSNHTVLHRPTPSSSTNLSPSVTLTSRPRTSRRTSHLTPHIAQQVR